MKKILTLMAGVLALAATSCVKENQTVFDPSKATAPVLQSYEAGEEAITALYAPAVFHQGFNDKIAPNHTLALVSLNGQAMSKVLGSSDKDGVLTLKNASLAKTLISLGCAEGSTASVELAVRASMQEPSKDNGRNGYVDSEGRISLGSFEVVVPEVVGSPYADYTENSDWTVIGALSAYGIGWDGDLNMWTDGANHVAAHVTLKAGDEFKFRKDLAWTVNMGGEFGGLDNEFAVTQDGANIVVGVDGVYDLFVNPDSGIAWITEAFDPYPDYTQESNWTVIGALSVHGINWDGDLPMISDGNWHVALGVSLAADDEFKFRQDLAWTVNLGGEFGGLDTEFAVEPDGANIAVGAAGVYDLFVNPGGNVARVSEASGAKVSSVVGSGDEPEPVAVTGWNLIGVNGDWENDVIATQDGSCWVAYISVAEPTAFKWRRDGGWDENYGGVFGEAGKPFEAVAGGDNIEIGAGFWQVVLDTEALTITISEGNVWSLIGDFNDWAGDVDMKLTDGKWVSPATHISGGFKIRHNHDWADNFGGTFATLGTAFGAVAGGDNISVEEGDYIVTYDPAAGTIVVDAALPANKWSVIGDFNGWAADAYMTEVAPGVWVSDALELTGGWKVRFNNGWDVNRGGATPEIPGTFVKAVPGGDNIGTNGTYHVVYNAGSETIGVLVWGVVGSIASLDNFSWNNDLPMNLASDGKWYSVPVALTTADQFKIRRDAGWDVNRGGTLAAAEEAFAVTNDGDNITVPADGTYMLVYDPAAETITLSTRFWGLIGDFNSWAGDEYMLYDGARWVAYGKSYSGGWKIRQGSGWDVNRGGTFAEAGKAFDVTNGGDNISVTGLDSFSIVYDPAAETITVE